MANTNGASNNAFGDEALSSNTSGDHNTAIGDDALRDNTTGGDNTANGASALLFNTTGGANTASGSGALASNTVGSANTAIGFQALFSNTTGNTNNAFGSAALTSNTTGGNNEAMGDSALHQNTAGNNNIADAKHVICIGTAGANLSGSCFIGNIFGVTSGGGTSVFINSDGQLGTMTSSGRFKEKIKPMEQASDALFALKPVTFRYKKEVDSQQIPQFGLVAEDVEKVNPDLVVRDKEGKPYSVRYEAVNAMLLNEFLKEHRKNEKQEATIKELKSQIAALAAMVKEQDAKIERVSAQLELSKSAPQTVMNNR